MLCGWQLGRARVMDSTGIVFKQSTSTVMPSCFNRCKLRASSIVFQPDRLPIKSTAKNLGVGEKRFIYYFVVVGG